MHKRHLVLAAFGIAALALAPPAFAKGARSATVTGPGLAAPLKLTSGGTAGTLGGTAYAAGFFDAVFGRSPDDRPERDLGPKYEISYVMPGPDARDHVIRQDVYPYASPPVTYMAPGQPIWGSEKTGGGWYVAGPELKRVLVDAGLPADPPRGGRSDPWLGIDAPWAIALVLLAGLGVLAARRRHAAAATAVR